VFLIAAIGLVFVYRILPSWLGFFPIVIGAASARRRDDPLPSFILFGGMITAVFGSIVFANPTLFRAILMTDWLFLLYLLAALYFPAEILSKRVAATAGLAWTAREIEADASSSGPGYFTVFSRRVVQIALLVLLGFFLVSGGRLIAL